MAIVSSEIFGVINKTGGRRKLLMKAVDQTGKIWERRPNVESANDDVATLAEWVIDLDSKLPELEAAEEAQRARDSVGSPAQHQPQADLDRRTLAILMKIDNASDFADTLPWFRDFESRGGPNATARARYLGVSAGDYALVTTRYNQISGFKSGLDGDAARVWQVGSGW